MNRSTREQPPLGGSGAAPSRGHGLESLLWQIIPASDHDRPDPSVHTEIMHSQVWIWCPPPTR